MAAASGGQTSEASAALAGLTEPGRVPRPHPFVDPWKKWAKDPVNVPLTLQVQNLYAASNTIVDIKLGMDSYSAEGLGCDTPTNGPTAAFGLKMHRDYKLTLIASNLNYAQVFLNVNPPWEPLSTSGKREVPKQYVLLVDNVAGTPSPRGSFTLPRPVTTTAIPGRSRLATSDRITGMRMIALMIPDPLRAMGASFPLAAPRTSTPIEFRWTGV